MDEFKFWYRGFVDEWGVWIGLATLVCLILLSIAKRIGILTRLEIWFQYAMEWATWMLVWAGILFYILYKFDDWREVKAETWILLVSIVVLYEILLKPIIQKNTQEAHDKLNKRAEDHRQHRL